MNSTYTLSHISIKTIYSNHIFLEYNKTSGIFTTKQIADDTFQLLAIFYSVIFHLACNYWRHFSLSFCPRQAWCRTPVRTPGTPHAKWNRDVWMFCT